MLLLSPFKNCSWTAKRNRNINTISTKLYITLTALLDKGPRCSECHEEGHSRGDTCLQLYLEQGHRVIFSQNRWYSLRETLTRPYVQPCQVCARTSRRTFPGPPPRPKEEQKQGRRRNHTLYSPKNDLLVKQSQTDGFCMASRLERKDRKKSQRLHESQGNWISIDTHMQNTRTG